VCQVASWYLTNKTVQALPSRPASCFQSTRIVLDSILLAACTRWFKYDRDKLWLVYTKIVPVIFEPPSMYVCMYYVCTYVYMYVCSENYKICSSSLSSSFRKVSLSLCTLQPFLISAPGWMSSALRPGHFILAEQEAGWVPEPVWTLWREQILVTRRESNTIPRSSRLQRLRCPGSSVLSTEMRNADCITIKWHQTPL
jgi:hypothetical protein